jgi:glycosyltransferase involved in cell wall biosynthesis
MRTISRGAIVIPHGDEYPVDDGPGALAPAVAPRDIANAIANAYENRDAISKAAREASSAVSAEWSWRNVTARFLIANHKELGITI